MSNRINEQSNADVEFNSHYDEAPDDAPLGRIAFATKRAGKPKEKDTPIEAKLYNSFINHFIDVAKLSDEDVQLIRQIMKNGWYKEIFHEPPHGTTIYRGMRVDRLWICEALRIDVPEYVGLKGDRVTPFTFTPKTAASSWTTDLATAENFSDVQAKGTYNIVLYAYIDANPGAFVDCNDALYNVGGLDNGEGEYEAIALGSVKVFRLRWRDIKAGRYGN